MRLQKKKILKTPKLSTSRLFPFIPIILIKMEWRERRKKSQILPLIILNSKFNQSLILLLLLPSNPWITSCWRPLLINSEWYHAWVGPLQLWLRKGMEKGSEGGCIGNSCRILSKRFDLQNEVSRKNEWKETNWNEARF